MKKLALLAGCILLLGAAASACMPIEEAPKHLGETTCVTGKVLKVVQTKTNTSFLDFCEDYRKCPFTVVVFAKDLANVGDVKLLEGKAIEIHGTIQQYEGRAQIVLRDKRQLKGEAAKLPPVPKTYDASRHGSFSAGKFKGAKKK